MGIGGNMGHVDFIITYLWDNNQLITQDVFNYSGNKGDHMKMKRNFSFSRLP